jgi:hypothetical protein
MKLLFGSFKIAIDAIDDETGDDIGIEIECNPKNRSFVMTTHQRKNKATAEVVDLTNDASANNTEKDATNKADDNGKKDDSFSSAGINIPYYLFDETDTPNSKDEEAAVPEEEESASDNDVEFIGSNNEKNNASLVQSDTSSEYECAVGFSQEVFTAIPRIPDAPRFTNCGRNHKGKKAN